MSNSLELKVLLSATDRITRPLRAIAGGSGAAAKALKTVRDQLKELNTEQSRIGNFNKSVESARKASAAYKEQKAALEALNGKLGAAKEHQASMVGAVKLARAEHAQLMRAFAKNDAIPGLASKLYTAKQALENLEGGYNKAKNASRRLNDAVKEATKDVNAAKKSKDGYSDALKRVTSELKEAGIGTKNLSARQEKLKSDIDKATAAAEKHGNTMQRLSAAQAKLEKTRATADKWGGRGRSMMAGGAIVGLPAAGAIKAYADFETAMLGVARQVNDAKDANGKFTATYYEIGQAVKAMSERLPMAANDIAKIVEGGARMGIQGKENLMIYAETTAVMASAFDLPVDSVGDDIGKISMLYKVPIRDIKALGDTINWLDDNALSKGGDIIDVMKRIAGTADMVKMNFREAAALGSTFLSLGATPEIAATASNAMIRELSIATMQSKRFLGGLDMLKLKAGSVQLGMNKDATGTIINVLEKIKALPSEKQLEAATRLFGKEYGDDAAKLASKLDEYRRQLKLVNDEKSRGSMQRESDTRGGTIDSRMTMGKNALINLASDLGKHLKPALVETMEKTLGIIQSLRNWSKENPELSAGIMTTVKYLAVGLTVIGGLTIAATAVLGPLALLKFFITTFGGSVFSVAGLLSRAFGMIGTAVMTLGRALLMNPIGLAITAIAVAAFLIYKYWDPIKAFFAGLWAGIKSGMSTAWDWIRGKIAEFVVYWLPVLDFVKSLPDRMLSAGAAMIDGFINGIMSRWATLKATVSELAAILPEWMRKPLKINSPSRVFAEIGGYTMQGLEDGILGGKDGPLGAVSSMAKKLAGIGAGVAIGGAAMAGDIPLDARPPINSGATTQGAVFAPNYNITVNAAPGMDEQHLAQMVAREIERLDSQRAARSRSRLRDTE